MDPKDIANQMPDDEGFEAEVPFSGPRGKMGEMDIAAYDRVVYRKLHMAGAADTVEDINRLSQLLTSTWDSKRMDAFADAIGEISTAIAKLKYITAYTGDK